NTKPRIVIPGTQVLRMAVLHSYQDDPALARTIDEAHADRFWQDLGNRTVGECLPGYPAKPVTASLDATLLELATLMGRLHSPLVAIVDHTHALVGAVTLNRLLINLALPDLDTRRHPRRTPHPRDARDECGTRDSHLRGRVLLHRNREGEQNRRRTHRGRRHGRHRPDSRVRGVLLRARGHRLERHLPSARHDDHRRGSQADRLRSEEHTSELQSR